MKSAGLSSMRGWCGEHHARYDDQILGLHNRAEHRNILRHIVLPVRVFRRFEHIGFVLIQYELPNDIAAGDCALWFSFLVSYIDQYVSHAGDIYGGVLTFSIYFSPVMIFVRSTDFSIVSVKVE